MGRLSTLRNLSASLWADDTPAVDAAVGALTGLTALSLSTSHAWCFASLTQLRCRWGPARPPPAHARAARSALSPRAMQPLAWSRAGRRRSIGRHLWLAPCRLAPPAATIFSQLPGSTAADCSYAKTVVSIFCSERSPYSKPCIAQFLSSPALRGSRQRRPRLGLSAAPESG